MTTEKQLSLEEAVNLLRQVSDGLHQQELNYSEHALCSKLERVWIEVTEFITVYDKAREVVRDVKPLRMGAVSFLLRQLASDERKEIIADYCKQCGAENKDCHCSGI